MLAAAIIRNISDATNAFKIHLDEIDVIGSVSLSVFLSMACMGVIQPSINNSDYLFNITNVAVTANNFIPIPGAEGTLQITIITLSSIFKDLGLAGQENNITQSIAL